MRRADGFGAIAVRDVGERRRDDLGRRREIGRERIEAERLDDANEREGRRLAAAEIATERKPQQRLPGRERDLGRLGRRAERAFQHGRLVRRQVFVGHAVVDACRLDHHRGEKEARAGFHCREQEADARSIADRGDRLHNLRARPRGGAARAGKPSVERAPPRRREPGANGLDPAAALVIEAARRGAKAANGRFRGGLVAMEEETDRAPAR